MKPGTLVLSVALLISLGVNFAFWIAASLEKSGMQRLLDSSLGGFVTGVSDEDLRVKLASGADPNYVMPDGERMIMKAAGLSNSPETVAILLHYGADPYDADHRRSVLNQAVLHDNVEVVERLSKSIIVITPDSRDALIASARSPEMKEALQQGLRIVE